MPSGYGSAASLPVRAAAHHPSCPQWSPLPQLRQMRKVVCSWITGDMWQIIELARGPPCHSSCSSWIQRWNTSWSLEPLGASKGLASGRCAACLYISIILVQFLSASCSSCLEGTSPADSDKVFAMLWGLAVSGRQWELYGIARNKDCSLSSGPGGPV